MALDLADAFGVDRDWSLIGGLMVQLHGFEHDDDPRPTEDIDILGGARRRPTMTERIARVLIERGAEVVTPPRSNTKLGYRSGGTQALMRTETILVSVGDSPPRPMRLPNLAGRNPDQGTGRRRETKRKVRL